MLSAFEAACLEVLNVLRSCLCMNVGSHETYKCFKFLESYNNLPHIPIIHCTNSWRICQHVTITSEIYKLMGRWRHYRHIADSFCYTYKMILQKFVLQLFVSIQINDISIYFSLLIVLYYEQFYLTG